MTKVEWKSIEETCNIIRGKRITKGNLLKDGTYPVISGGITPMGYLDSYNREANTITISQYGTAGYVDYQTTKFWANDICYCVYPKDILNNKYLWYVLKNKQNILYAIRNTDAVPYSLPIDTLKKIKIPVPSLSEQERIVGILDTFTASIDNLKEQITLRRKQFEYYRDQLLDLEGKEGVEMKTLGEMFTFKNGLNKGKEYFGTGKPIIMFTNVYNSRHLNSAIITNKVNITDNELERIDAKFGDVFFTRTSETKEDVGYASVLLEDVGECTFAGFLIRARPITNKLMPSYCKYCFSTPEIRKSIVENSSFTTRASLTGTGLGKVVMPVPSIPEQQRIVGILDTFEACITNLEAQLSLRQKQYEYYRNQLLTFE